MTFYIEDLGIHGFLCLWGEQNQSPMDTEVNLLGSQKLYVRWALASRTHALFKGHLYFQETTIIPTETMEAEDSGIIY